MQLSPEEIKQMVRSAFNAAASHFDHPSLHHWDHIGRATVDFAEIAGGDRVLDVCCGTGASALPAAARAGAAGWVDGVDLASELLDLARAKARAQGLDNVAFRTGDMAGLEVPDGAYDTVMCVLGLFFAPDMTVALGELYRAVRPGGSLVITTWGKQVFEPANSIFWETVGQQRPDLVPETLPYTAIDTPGKLSELFGRAGLPDPMIRPQRYRHPAAPDDFWTIALGSGYRMTIDKMGEETAGRVRATLTSRLTEAGVTESAADLIFARATKPL